MQFPLRPHCCALRPPGPAGVLSHVTRSMVHLLFTTFNYSQLVLHQDPILCYFTRSLVHLLSVTFNSSKVDVTPLSTPNTSNFNLWSHCYASRPLYMPHGSRSTFYQPNSITPNLVVHHLQPSFVVIILLCQACHKV